MEALGKSRGGGGDTLFLQHRVQKSWGGRGKGSGYSLVSQLSQQVLKRVKSLGRETCVWVCFPAQPLCVYYASSCKGLLGVGSPVGCWGCLLLLVYIPGHRQEDRHVPVAKAWQKELLE